MEDRTRLWVYRITMKAPVSFPPGTHVTYYYERGGASLDHPTPTETGLADGYVVFDQGPHDSHYLVTSNPELTKLGIRFDSPDYGPFFQLHKPHLAWAGKRTCARYSKRLYKHYSVLDRAFKKGGKVNTILYHYSEVEKMFSGKFMNPNLRVFLVILGQHFDGFLHIVVFSILRILFGEAEQLFRSASKAHHLRLDIQNLKGEIVPLTIFAKDDNKELVRLRGLLSDKEQELETLEQRLFASAKGTGGLFFSIISLTLSVIVFLNQLAQRAGGH